jgi:hypothetical protein
VFDALRRDPTELGHGQPWRLLTPVLVQSDHSLLAIIGVFVLCAVIGVAGEWLLPRSEWLLLYLLGALAGHGIGETFQPHQSSPATADVPCAESSTLGASRAACVCQGKAQPGSHQSPTSIPSIRVPGACRGPVASACAMSPWRHSRRDCRSPPDPEAAKVAARNACGDTKAGANRLTAFALLLATSATSDCTAGACRGRRPAYAQRGAVLPRPQMLVAKWKAGLGSS